MNGRSRYPGTRAFEEDEQLLFFGRNEEIRRLHALVLANNLVVLFAKSGIGKSSLLNAGLIPLLDYDRFCTVKVRFQNLSDNPADTLKKALVSYLDATALRTHTGLDSAAAPLWEYLRACRFKRYDEPVIPVLVFDQFEEFFEHPVEARAQFIQEFADLANNRLPSRVYERIAGLPADQRPFANPDWQRPVALKVIFSIRADRIGFLHDLSADIQPILQNRFKLKPLNRAQAREAIVQPASIAGKDFALAAFSYAQEALDLILDSLENKHGEVESFQLQLVCQYIERQIVKKKFAAGSAVTEDVFGGTDGIRNILQNYYENTLAELLPDEQILAREFIERGLIVSGRRVGVTEGVEQEVWHIGSPILKKLLDCRLLRTEVTHLGKSYEISHDALVEPILRSFRVREAERLEQENRRLEREALLQNERLENERRLKNQAMRNARRARIFAGISIVLLLLALAMGYASLYIFQDNFLRQAADKLQSQQYREAIDLYDQVLYTDIFKLTLFPRDSVMRMRDSAQQLYQLQGMVLQADTFYFAGNYFHAYMNYASARRLGYLGLDDKIDRTSKVLDLTLELYRRKARVFEEAIDPHNDDGALEEACGYYCMALHLDPEAPDLKEKVKKLHCKCANQ